jgi:twitching motility protein PilT
VDLHSLLLRAVQTGASDVHLKIGQHPIFRRDGTLLPVDGWPELGRMDLENVLATVTTPDPAKRSIFEQSGELDLAYTPTGLPRFRVNGYRQRGAISFAFRLIPS